MDPTAARHAALDRARRRSHTLRRDAEHLLHAVKGRAAGRHRPKGTTGSLDVEAKLKAVRQLVARR